MRATVLAAIAAALVLAVVAQQLLHAQTGALPLAGVFELHLLVAAEILAVLAIVGSLRAGPAAAWTRLIALGVVVLVIVRAGGELWSSPPDPVGETMTVLSWNLEMESKPGAEAAKGIAAIDADLVALQELTPVYADAIEADRTLVARYPYRILDPRPGPEGLGVLSKLPLVVRPDDAGPRILHAGLLLPHDVTAELFDVHARRPLYRTIGPIPVALDTQDRDDDVQAIAAAIGPPGDGQVNLVVGDLNGAWTEPGLEPLRKRTVDAHEVTGTGPGF